MFTGTVRRRGGWRVGTRCTLRLCFPLAADTRADQVRHVHELSAGKAAVDGAGRQCVGLGWVCILSERASDRTHQHDIHADAICLAGRFIWAPGPGKNPLCRTAAARNIGSYRRKARRSDATVTTIPP
jgi:hypothetical protein